MKALTVLVLVLGQTYVPDPSFKSYGSIHLPSNTFTIEPREPSELTYVLVTRGGAGAWELSDNGFYVFQENRRKFQAVMSPEAAIEILQGSEESVFIGLWKLDDKNRVEIKHEEIEHEKEIKIEKESWVEHKWSVGD